MDNDEKENNIRCKNCGNKWFSEKVDTGNMLDFSIEEIHEREKLHPKYCQDCNQKLDIVGFEVLL